MTSTKRIPVIIAFIVMLSACGFQLRGTYDLATGLSPVFVNTSEREIRYQLRSQLAANGIDVAAGVESSASELSVYRSRRSRRVISVDSRGRAREYELRYDLSYRLNYDTGAGKRKLEKNIELSRDLLFDPDSVLAINSEIESLYTDMQRDAARIILRQLQAVQ